ncbi:HAD-IC family P-type ATPase [Lutibaculum baratangense]|uniref:Ca ion P-type ATPase n=1 Tax=Lutibaculum baratangense AMV1 TaxID=631454 RepID=V4TK25_9HYPH|nr:HAD-IC family P-type ATPase [Lutibaculum baratangense]ESR26243.1 Ca ion P-type ATPase [Lutibaculum baratangense AMV1]
MSDTSAEAGNAAPAWHALPAADVLGRLETTDRGLTEEEAGRRLERYGENRLPRERQRSPVLRFLAQFNNVLIYILLAASLITMLIGHFSDAAVIAGVVVINAIVGFVQEGKAESALAAIGRLLQAHANVLRDGSRREIEATRLVPGDIVFLEAGDRVPADLRLLSARGLEIEEAVLTGESVPTCKERGDLAVEAPLGDRANMAFFGTMATRGQGQGVVVATGSATEIGRIGRLLETVQTLTTPLLRKIDRFGKLLTLVILAASVGMFAYGTLVASFSADEMLLVTVGIAVAAVPEGLPAILTIALAIGVERMARRNAIVRRLPAVETLGSITVICTDKTGTLTRNEMMVERVVTADGMFAVSGSGYGPEGEVRALSPDASEDGGRDLLAQIAAAAALASDAQIHEGDPHWHVAGDPMEGALLAFAHKVAVDPATVREARSRVDVIPFDSGHAYMATLNDLGGGAHTIHIKGAPERVIALCGYERTAEGDRPIDGACWHDRVSELADLGHRVLAIALRPEADPHGLGHEHLPGAVLLGLVGISDPPRQEAMEAVAKCREAGIAVKMITGDHAATARAIGARFGLVGDRALTGADLDAMDDAGLSEAVAEVDVFARTTPEHKLRLVEALQARGDVVAMTGDGVNDAPALKRADVGVAMGQKGSEAAKQVAEIVLADDNFASIGHAVEEGRTVYANLQKSIAFILPTNAGESMVLLFALFVGLALPVTALQILWINMVTTVTLALALGFEPGEPTTMQRPPRPPAAPLLSPFLVWRIAFVGAIMTAVSFSLFLWGEARYGLEEGRSLAVNAIVAMEAGYLLNSRSLTGSILNRKGLFGSPYAIGAIGLVSLLQIGFTEWSVSQAIFGTASLPPLAWAMAVAAGFVLLFLVEGEKVIARRVRRSRRPRGGAPARSLASPRSAP